MRVTLDWHAPEVSLPRKISSLQFTIKSLQRHLERLMSIEEEGGYMSDVLAFKPQYRERVDRLAGDHDQFRARLVELVPDLQSLSEWDEANYRRVCDDLRDLLDSLDRHDRHEVELLQQSLLEEEGGEG
jgi:hypothetical protein